MFDNLGKTLHLQSRVPAMLVFEGSWPGQPYRVMASDAAYLGGDRFDVEALNVEADVRYVMVIASP